MIEAASIDPAKSGDAAIAKDENLIEASKRAPPVRDHNYDPAAPAYRCNRSIDMAQAIGIEVGVRLVEHHEEGIAVQRTRKRQSLTLAD